MSKFTPTGMAAGAVTGHGADVAILKILQMEGPLSEPVKDEGLGHSGHLSPPPGRTPGGRRR